MKIKLADGKTRIIKLSGDDTIEVLKSLEFEIYENLTALGKAKGSNSAIIIPFLQEVIVNWDVVGEDGQKLPFSKENIAKMDGIVAMELFQLLSPDYEPQKKSSLPLDEQSSTEIKSEEKSAVVN